MKCPFCQTPDTRVVDSRTSNEGLAIRRRRECAECGNRFTTYETIAEFRISVIKKDGSRIPFEREKVRVGVEKACYKRPVPREAIEDLATRVEAEIARSGETEITTQHIGQMVMDELQRLDQVAYVRFASVYREFKDVSDFEHEIRPMLAKQAE